MINPRSHNNNTRFSLDVEDQRADAGRYGRASLAGPNSHARTGTGKKYLPSVQLTTSKTGNHNELMSNLLDIK